MTWQSGGSRPSRLAPTDWKADWADQAAGPTGAGLRDGGGGLNCLRLMAHAMA